MKCAPLSELSLNKHPVVAEDTDLEAPDMGKAADQRGAVSGLIFVKTAAVDQTRDHLADVELHFDIARNDTVKLFRIVIRRLRRDLLDVQLRRVAVSAPPVRVQSRSPAPRLLPDNRRCRRCAYAHRRRLILRPSRPRRSPPSPKAAHPGKSRRCRERSRCIRSVPARRRRPPCNGQARWRPAERPFFERIDWLRKMRPAR